MDISIFSNAFENDGTIPQEYTCDGDDLSPPLEWSGIPTGTQSLVLICDDPDAPVGTWVHWVIFNISPEINSLPKGVPDDAFVAELGTQGTNDFGKIGYGGPCPPKGKPHRYFFKLYALDSTFNLDPGAKKSEVEKSMQGHILGEGKLIGTYGR